MCVCVSLCVFVCVCIISQHFIFKKILAHDKNLDKEFLLSIGCKTKANKHFLRNYLPIVILKNIDSWLIQGN